MTNLELRNALDTQDDVDTNPDWIDSVWHSDYVAFAFLVPAASMKLLHWYLGLSDALSVKTPAGEREAHLFNWLMVVAFFGGVAAFLLHAGYLERETQKRPLVKILLLALFWLWFISPHSR